MFKIIMVSFAAIAIFTRAVECGTPPVLAVMLAAALEAMLYKLYEYWDRLEKEREEKKRCAKERRLNALSAGNNGTYQHRQMQQEYICPICYVALGGRQSGERITIFPILREVVGIIAEDELVRIENEYGGTLDVDACSELATTWDEWETVRIYTDCNGIVVVVREPDED